MIYNNLIYLLVVILIFTTKGVPESPLLPLYFSLPVILLKFFLYYRWALPGQQARSIQNDREYFAAEQRFSILAIIFFSVDVYLLDFKYYLSQLPLSDQLPILVDAGGLLLFFLYLGIMWAAHRDGYHAAFCQPFGRYYTLRAFIVANIKNNLPIVLPWLILSLISDLLRLTPLPFINKIAYSQWAETVSFLLFFVLLAATFPAMIKRLWNCTPLPPGPARSHLENFCRQQGLKYADIMLWPLFEGRVLTAGVMGILKKFRYLLITPGLLSALNSAELDAVVAHEIGHVKKYHLQLYLLLFIGFGLLVGIIANPVLYLLLQTDLFYQMITWSNNNPDTLLAFWGTVPLFIIMIVYFRYIFGFFIRNFERQADLYVFKALGNSDQLVNSFEKIAWLSGNTRDLPSWHHFSIAERVDFLKKCQRHPAQIKKHDRKVFLSLLVYLLILLGGAALFWQMPVDSLDARYQGKIIEAVIKQKIRQEPANALWVRLLADLKQEMKMDQEAAAAYQEALRLEPADPEVLNNLAWLLVMTGDEKVADPHRALELAGKAAELRPEGFILDTLAAAYWANGLLAEAVATEEMAAAKDPANRNYYQKQIRKFQETAWPGSRMAD